MSDPHQKFFPYHCFGCGSSLYHKNHITMDGKLCVQIQENHKHEWMYIHKGMHEKIFLCKASCLELFLNKRMKEMEDMKVTRLRHMAEKEERERKINGYYAT